MELDFIGQEPTQEPHVHRTCFQMHILFTWEKEIQRQQDIENIEVLVAFDLHKL